MANDRNQDLTQPTEIQSRSWLGCSIEVALYFILPLLLTMCSAYVILPIYFALPLAIVTLKIVRDRKKEGQANRYKAIEVFIIGFVVTLLWAGIIALYYGSTLRREHNSQALIAYILGAIMLGVVLLITLVASVKAKLASHTHADEDIHQKN